MKVKVISIGCEETKPVMARFSRNNDKTNNELLAKCDVHGNVTRNYSIAVQGKWAELDSIELSKTICLMALAAY